MRCEVKNLAEAAEAEGITKTALIIVGGSRTEGL